MLDYQERVETGGSRLYEYYVEGDRSMAGMVSVDVNGGTCEIVRLADNDRFSRYANHLADALERSCRAGTLKASGTVMWY